MPATPGTSGLAAELSFGTDLARDTGDFRGETAQLIHHRVDRILELQNLSFDVHRNLFDRSPLATAMVTSAMLRTCAVKLPAMALTLSVRSFQVPATPATTRLPTEFSVRADLACDPR